MRGRRRVRAEPRACAAVVAGLLLGLWLPGCGPTVYTAELLSAERKFDEATEENARFHAPYEYYFAEAHLAKAREEAAEASYEEAIRFAKIAASFSVRAKEITRRRRLATR